MKQRKHIEEFFIEGMATWLRRRGKEDSAKILDGCKPGTFVRSSYTYNSGFGYYYGSDDAPNTFNDGNVKFTNWQPTISITKEDGTVITTEKLGLPHLINMIPKQIRPKYIGTMPSTASSVWAPKTLGIDESKPGCRFWAVAPSGLYGFVVIVGKDEDPTDPAVLDKYLPYETGIVNFKNSTSTYWGFGGAFQVYSDIMGVRFWVWGWKGTGDVPEVKEVNPNLPTVHYQYWENKALPGYTSVPAFTVNIDWEFLRGKYDKKVHYYQPILDAIENGLRTAGDTANADLIKSINPKTFKPFAVTTSNATKQTIWKGAQDSTTKLYFEGITWNYYLASADAVKMYPHQLNFIYSEESGLNWPNLTNGAAAQTNKITGYQAENAGHKFYRHLPTGTIPTRDVIESGIPFDMTGVMFNNQPYSAPTTAVSFNWDYVPYEINYCGINTLGVSFYMDL